MFFPAHIHTKHWTHLQALQSDPVTREALTHLQQCVDKCSKIVPRKEILDQIKSYVCGTSDKPLVVHGQSGCGKTSIMAYAANNVRIQDSLQWYEGVLPMTGTKEECIYSDCRWGSGWAETRTWDWYWGFWVRLPPALILRIYWDTCVLS